MLHHCSSARGLRPQVALCALFLLANGGLAGCSEEVRIAWPNGVLRAQGAGRPGAEEGLWHSHYADGQLRERGAYQGGIRHGLWVQWWPNGQRASAGLRQPSADGRTAPRQGLWTFWYESGEKRAEGHYEEGLRVGPWTFWQEKGAIDANQSGVYEQGERVGS